MFDGKRTMRLLLWTLTGVLAGAGTAGAATISVALSSDNSTCANGTSNDTNESSVCSQNGSLTVDDWGAAWSTAGGTSSNLSGVGSTSTGFSIDAAVAADDGGADVGQGGDRWIQAALNFSITLTVDVDNPGDSWTVDLSQSVLGLFALNGDGTLSAVGSQNAGLAEVATPFSVSVDGSPFDFSASPSSYSNNPSNNSSASQQFSGGRSDLGVLSGTGDGVFAVSIDFDLEALSRDGCSGFICSSASGGEEAAVLFGAQSVIDQDVDEYSTWSRAIGPDGYTSTWTLNVTAVPEPGATLLLGAAVAGVALALRRR
jgi:hypothetical protein